MGGFGGFGGGFSMDLVYFLISAVVALALGIPFLLLTRRTRPAGEQVVAEARRAGRVVRGVLEKSTFLRADMSDDSRDNRRDQWIAVYGYVVNGVHYTYRETVFNDPVPELTLYYPAGRPGAAISQGAAAARFGGGYLLRALVPLVIWAAVYWILREVW